MKYVHRLYYYDFVNSVRIVTVKSLLITIMCLYFNNIFYYYFFFFLYDINSPCYIKYKHISSEYKRCT
jgi:hypothetical protein